jgi:hypothetical protein
VTPWWYVALVVGIVLLVGNLGSLAVGSRPVVALVGVAASCLTIAVSLNGLGAFS